LIFVAKSLEGEIEVIRTSDVHTGALTQALLGIRSDATTDDADAWYAADAIEPGNAAGIMVIEHRWSIPLRAAIASAGGTNVVTEWVDEADVVSLGVALPAD
jgi:hypothetical protein